MIDKKINERLDSTIKCNFLRYSKRINIFFKRERNLIFLPFSFLILSQFASADVKIKKDLAPLHPSVDCIQLLIYFDIDNTSNSYFNNITYFLNKYEKIVNGKTKEVNILIAENFFENKTEMNLFLVRLKVDTAFWHINIIQSDSLLNIMNDFKGLAKYRFIKNGIPIISGVCKWDEFATEQEKINCDLSKNKIKLTLIDKTNIKKKAATNNNVIRIIDSNNIVIANDYYNKLMFLQFYKKSLSYKEAKWQDYINPMEVYCKYFAKNKEACEVAKSNAAEIKKMSKEEAFFVNLSFNDSFIFAALNFYAHEIWDNDFYYINDIGVADTIKKGQVIANQFSVILKFDRKLNYISYIPVSDDGITSLKNQKLLAGTDFGFYIDNKDKLYSYLTPFDTNFKDSDLDFSFGVFEIDDKGKYIFKKFEKTPFPENFSSTWFASSFVKPVFLDNKLTTSFGTYDWFYLGDRKIYIDKERDKSTLPKENIFAHFRKNEEMIYNYNILGISKDYTSKYCIVFYKVGSDYCVEVFDKSYKTIAIKILNEVEYFPKNLKFEDLDSGAFDLNQNILSFNFRDKASIYLLRFKITINE